MVRITAFLFAFIICLNVGSQTPTEVDSLRNALKTANSTRDKISTLNRLGIELGNSKDASLPLYKKALQLAIKTNEDSLAALTHGNIATVYYYAGQHDSALHSMLQVVKHHEKMGRDDLVSRDMGNLGILYRKLHNLPKSLECFQIKLTYDLTRSDTGAIASTYNNMSNLYENLEDFEKALEMQFKSLEMRKHTNDLSGITSNYNNLANIYSSMGYKDSALHYYEKALEVGVYSGTRTLEGNLLNNYGMMLESVGKYQEAEKYLLMSLNLRDDTQYLRGISQTCNNLADLYLSLGQLDKATDYVNRGYAISVQHNYPSALMDAIKLKSSIAAKRGDYKNGYLLFRKFYAMKDSLNDKDQTKKIAELEMSYKYEQARVADSIRTEKEIAIKEKEAELATLQLSKNQERQKYYLVGGLVIGFLMLIVIFVIYRGYRVKTRSHKLITRKNALINEQNETLEIKNKEILDSINYAKRIQSAILPEHDAIRKHLNDFFILYEPKDIVAGDFYWFKEQEDNLYLAVADCTGHGVPGALVSVVCSNALNRAVNELKMTETDAILSTARNLVIEELAKSSTGVKDGMDIALIRMKLSEGGTIQSIQFSGAHNPLWIIRKASEELVEIKGDKQPVGEFEDMRSFTAHEVNVSKGDQLYIFSDGYADQFGGHKGKKLKTTNFKKLIQSVSNQDMKSQGESLLSSFQEWTGNHEQLDDVCVIGVRV